MIELTFNQSAGGGLKLAQAMQQGQEINSTVLRIGGKGEEGREAGKPRPWTGLTMEGSPKDVEALTLVLDKGDISDLDTDMNSRPKLLDQLFGDYPGVSGEIWTTSKQALTRLQEAKATREAVRIWVCAGNPEELCGLYYVCHLLEDAAVPLSMVGITEEVEKDKGMISYRSVGEIIPEALGGYAAGAKPISPLRRKVYADTWLDLVRENAPLRAVINGSLLGVPEDFYDFALRANMPEGEFKMAWLIGSTLGQIPGVGDRWLFLRVQKMLETGELIRVSGATEDHPYSEVVKRGKPPKAALGR